MAFYINLNLLELSYRFYLKFNITDTHISWKGYLTGNLPPKIKIQWHIRKKIVCLNFK